MVGRVLQIGVIGGREVSREILDLAEETGREIGRKGAILICGGLGGVMEAACKGAKSAGGTTVGILPVILASEANPYVDIVIPTGMGIARNAVIIHSCDAVIAVGGKYGTLSEMAFALQKNIPIVSLKSWKVDENVYEAETAREAIHLVFLKIKQ